jgi:hypothetical protein
MNTTQVRNRLPVLMNRYGPELVIVWAGVNNIWNVAEMDEGEGHPWLRGLATRSRLYRMIRVFIHDRDLERVARSAAANEGHEIIAAPPVLGLPEQQFTVAHDGIAENIVHSRGDDPVEARAASERAEVDYRAIRVITAAAGIGLIFIAYPQEEHEAFRAANRAMRNVSSEFGTPAVVEARQSLSRVPPGEVEWLWGAHPNGRLYAEIARDVLPLVIAHAGESEVR